MGNNRYGIHWIYVCSDGDVLVVYGQDSYTLLAAQAAQPLPTLPNHVAQFSWLAGKVIIAKNDTSYTEIESAYDISFTSSTAADHNELGGLDGGTADEYFHLTSADYVDRTTQSEVDAYNIIQDTSHLADVNQLDASVARIDLYNIIQDTSINALNLGVSQDYVDGSISSAVDAVDSSLVTYVDTTKILNASPSIDVTGNGIIIVMNSSTAITVMDAVYISGGSIAQADADASISMPAIGLALGAAAGGDIDVSVLIHGVVRNDSWTWANSLPIYVSITAGELTQVPPSGTGDQVQIMGMPITADIMLVNPNYTLVSIT